MRIVTINGEVATCKCGTELQMVPVEGAERSQFSFVISHKKDGTPIKNLDTKGPELCIVELGWCEICQHHMVVIDSTEDKEYWSKLPKWHQTQ